MYAVVGIWALDPGRWEEQQRGLNEQIVHSVKRSPGFVTGYWMGDQATGTTYTTIVLEDEESAKRFKASVEANAANQKQAGVTPKLLTIVEVLAEAHR